jgi:hypothetical protein
MEEGKLYCRQCKATKNADEFYKYSPRRCKECHRNKPNPKAIGRHPEKVNSAQCLGKCGLVLPKDKFSISDKTGLLMDKCISCKILYRGSTPPSTPKGVEGEIKSDNMIVESQMQIIHHLNRGDGGELVEASEEDRRIYLHLEVWLRGFNLIKGSYAKIADIAARLAM